jgi:hypothetical protein
MNILHRQKKQELHRNNIRIKMDFTKRLLALGFGVTAIAIQAGSALAIPYNANIVYKVSVEGVDQVIISGTANTGIAVKYEGQERTSARIAGACGEVRISSTTGQYSGLEVDDVAIDASTLPTNTLPTCNSGAFAEPRTANFKLPTGQVIIVGKTPSAAVKVMIPGDSTRNVTLNACGFTTLKPTSTTPLPATFMVGTTQYTTASLTMAPDGPPICRKSGLASIGYKPASW